MNMARNSLYPVIIIDESIIEKTDFRTTKPTIFEIHKNSVKYEFLICYKMDSKAIICGTGSIQRDKNPLPIFSRHSWTSDFENTVIYYADPTLYNNDLTLTWYYGTKECWYLKEIADILKVLLKQLGINKENTLCFGSSGGGYSSIVVATMLCSKATVINPQCNILNYYREYVKRFRETIVQSTNEELLNERTNVINVIKAYNYMPVIHYIQNIKCRFDMENQLYPFLKELDENGIYCNEKLMIDFYSDVGGHNAMPDKQYCLRIIENDLNIKMDNYTAPVFLCDSYVNGIGINIETTYMDNILTIRINPLDKQADFEYAYYLIDINDEIIEKKWYSDQTKCEFNILQKGKYRIKYYIKSNQQKYSFYTSFIDCQD